MSACPRDFPKHSGLKATFDRHCLKQNGTKTPNDLSNDLLIISYSISTDPTPSIQATGCAVGIDCTKGWVRRDLQVATAVVEASKEPIVARSLTQKGLSNCLGKNGKTRRLHLLHLFWKITKLNYKSCWNATAAIQGSPQWIIIDFRIQNPCSASLQVLAGVSQDASIGPFLLQLSGSEFADPHSFPYIFSWWGSQSPPQKNMLAKRNRIKTKDHTLCPSVFRFSMSEVWSILDLFVLEGFLQE